MLATTERAGSFAALIDPARSFDPNSYTSSQLRRLLCVFCDTPEKAVKVADLLLRDGNLPLVLLDFQAVPRRNLGRLPASTWHRFQRLVEKKRDGGGGADYSPDGGSSARPAAHPQFLESGGVVPAPSATLPITAFGAPVPSKR